MLILLNRSTEEQCAQDKKYGSLFLFLLLSPLKKFYRGYSNFRNAVWPSNIDTTPVLVMLLELHSNQSLLFIQERYVFTDVEPGSLCEY